jgi:hypothetical protein
LKRKRYGQKRKKKKKKKPIRKARPGQHCSKHAKGCRPTLLIYIPRLYQSWAVLEWYSVLSPILTMRIENRSAPLHVINQSEN